MAKFIATLKAIFTRIIFGTHGAIAIWQVTQYKKNPIYWTLSTPIGLLALEGIFTLAIKKNQEWRWFCPSVFLYLSSVVPAIWLLELDKVERRHRIQEETFNLAAAAADLKELDKLLGVNIKLPELKIDGETWVTLIEQFLMLVLIIGRWLLPKGDLTRDQLSQLLLVYIGTAADIIEFFDSFKDNKIADEQILVFLTLSIWSWSLLQFTIVLTATRARKPRGASSHDTGADEGINTCCSDCLCCSIDIWAIFLNIILQDAPFLTFRLLIIIHYQIISYMNVFFTCKNTLVILLQLYRLYVVYSENQKTMKKRSKFHQGERNRSTAKGSSNKGHRRHDSDDIYIISNEKPSRSKKRKYENDSDENDDRRRDKKKNKSRKDTGYGTAGSSYEDKRRNKDKDNNNSSAGGGGKRKEKRKSRKDDESNEKSKRRKKSHDDSSNEDEEEIKSKKNSKRDKIVEVSESDSASERSMKKKSKSKKKASSTSSTSSSSE